MIQDILGREQGIFAKDIMFFNNEIEDAIKGSRVLVIGAAGTIGASTTREIFKRKPAVLHAVDISENNLVELVRGIRSTLGYLDVDFRTFAIDVGSVEFQTLVGSERSYDYVFNLSALKHVRSERDHYTLMRMVQTNIFNTIDALELVKSSALKKYFCVSTDKAANPVNMMGASKRIMELFLKREGENFPISMARFANVAFSDGSLLHGFNQRFLNREPMAAPTDVTRYFITPKESGELCLLAGMFGKDNEIFIPKERSDFKLISFKEILIKFLEEKGFKAHECVDEEDARLSGDALIANGYWPCVFFQSDTTGEKSFEEFSTADETVLQSRFQTVNVITTKYDFDADALEDFTMRFDNLYRGGVWSKTDILTEFKKLLPNFNHSEKGKFLDQKM